MKGSWTINFGYATLTLEDSDSGFDADWDKAQAHLEVEYNFATTGNHRWGVLGGIHYTDHEWELKDKWSWSNRADYGFAYTW